MPQGAESAKTKGQGEGHGSLVRGGRSWEWLAWRRKVLTDSERHKPMLEELPGGTEVNFLKL